MPLTESDLRDVLAERSASPPPDVPDRLAAVRRRARRARVRTAGGAVLALAALAVAIPLGARLTARPEPAAVPPAQQGVSPAPQPTDVAPGPTTTYTTEGNGVRTTTTGPTEVPGYSDAFYPFTVTVLVTNTSAVPWTGTIGVGVYGRPVNYFDQNEPGFLDRFTDGSPDATGWFTLSEGKNRVEGFADPQIVTLQPAEFVRVTFRLVKFTIGFPHTAIHGWLPVLHANEAGVEPQHPPLDGLRELTFTSKWSYPAGRR